MKKITIITNKATNLLKWRSIKILILLPQILIAPAIKKKRAALARIEHAINGRIGREQKPAESVTAL